MEKVRVVCYDVVVEVDVRETGCAIDPGVKTMLEREPVATPTWSLLAE